MDVVQSAKRTLVELQLTVAAPSLQENVNGEGGAGLGR